MRAMRRGAHRQAAAESCSSSQVTRHSLPEPLATSFLQAELMCGRETCPTPYTRRRCVSSSRTARLMDLMGLFVCHSRTERQEAEGSGGYDRVLVDAECTHDGSLRHMAKVRFEWSKRSTATLMSLAACVMMKSSGNSCCSPLFTHLLPSPVWMAVPLFTHCLHIITACSSGGGPVVGPSGPRLPEHAEARGPHRPAEGTHTVGISTSPSHLISTSPSQESMGSLGRRVEQPPGC